MTSIPVAELRSLSKVTHSHAMSPVPTQGRLPLSSAERTQATLEKAERVREGAAHPKDPAGGDICVANATTVFTQPLCVAAAGVWVGSHQFTTFKRSLDSLTIRQVASPGAA